MSYFKEYLEKYKDKKIKLFVDMDGVVADYDVGIPYNFDKKRPLKTNIAKLEEASKNENIELYICSVSRLKDGIKEKNAWLDIHAPFFKKENRIILDRESHDYKTSCELKAEYYQSVERDGRTIIVIDDDPMILREIGETSKDIIRLKDTVLVD